mgnify:CR=1 FL=1
MAIANEKKLNFNTDEIEAEQLLDIFQDDKYLETELSFEFIITGIVILLPETIFKDVASSVNKYPEPIKLVNELN